MIRTFAMRNDKLPNYLRTYRKRSGFSQEELAFVVQLSDKSELCKLERFHREPSHRTAVACAMALRVSTAQLFAGIEVSTEKETTRRLRRLRKRLAAQSVTGGRLRNRLAHKLQQIGECLGEFIFSSSV